jgi:hypothetical protein
VGDERGHVIELAHTHATSARLTSVLIASMHV